MGNCIKTKSSKNALSKGVTESNKDVLCKEETDKGIFILGLFSSSRFCLWFASTKSCLFNQNSDHIFHIGYVASTGSPQLARIFGSKNICY
jgi:hypothetical protein